MAATSTLTAEHIRRLERIRQREDAVFRSRVTTSQGLDQKAREVMPRGVPMAWMAGLYRTPPLWVSHAAGATFTDVDGNDYLDFNVCDMSAVLGYAHPRLAEVISEQARRGVQLFLPVEAALAVCFSLSWGWFQALLRDASFNGSLSVGSSPRLPSPSRYATARN